MVMQYAGRTASIQVSYSSEVSATAASHCTMHIQCIVALRVKRLQYLRTAGVKELFDFIPRTFGLVTML